MYTNAGVQINSIQSISIITVALVAPNSIGADLRAIVCVLNTFINI